MTWVASGCWITQGQGMMDSARQAGQQTTQQEGGAGDDAKQEGGGHHEASDVR
jgi:hypothetical protein